MNCVLGKGIQKDSMSQNASSPGKIFSDESWKWFLHIGTFSWFIACNKASCNVFNNLYKLSK